VEVIAGAGLVPAIAAGDWPDRQLKADDKQTAAHEPGGVTVEESGPARVVVAIKGGFTPGDKDKKFYDFTARLYFTAGSPALRIIYTISNGRLDPAFYPLSDGKGKSRLAFVWPIKDATLSADLALDAPAGAAVQTDPPHGVIDIGGGTAGVTIARRFSREEGGGPMEGNEKHLRLGLFPAEGAGPIHLSHGQRKSWDLRLTLRGKEAVDKAYLAARFDEQDCLLLFRPDPAWMVWAGGESGAWSAGLALTDKPTRNVKGMRRAADKVGSPGHGGTGGWAVEGGWDHFGVISSWNSGGTHWNEQTAFFNWVIHGIGAEFDNSEIPTLWAADHCPIHFDNPDQDAFFPYTARGATDHCRMKILTYPGYVDRTKGWGRPDTGHMGMWMWIEYYLLTGDARVREAVCHLGEMGRGHLWQYTHEEKKDDSGPLSPGQFRPFKKFDPDADPSFKLDTRYIAWPVYCLCQYYQLSGDPAILEEARITARAFRNTARGCPIGVLVREPGGKNGTETTEYSATFGFPNGNGGVASQVREWPKSASLVQSNFYQGFVIYALREYYLISRDIEALDAMTGQIDRFCHYSMIRDPQNKLAGWTYIFADYWGPYTWEDSFAPKTGKSAATFTGVNDPVVDSLARVYPLTGRADLLEVLKAAAADDGNTGEHGNLVIALQMATLHPKVHATPPAAIKDLAAEPQGGGKVKLTWTAPAGAAWYQVKYTGAEKLVERIAGWPDRTEPLPQSRKDWLERAAAFNAKQRSFWAAINLPGAPKPGAAAAGAKESMVVEGLPAGKLNFGIKSWDAFDNMSELSNVVQAEVK
jgi:hypothetical protein